MKVTLSRDEVNEAIMVWMAAKFPDRELVKPQDISPEIRQDRDDPPELESFSVMLPEFKKPKADDIRGPAKQRAGR